MATYELTLATPPDDLRARELWLQHAAGMIIFEDARQYAIDRIGSDADEQTRAQILKGINDAIYGMMMIFDGVTGGLNSKTHRVRFQTMVQLLDSATGEVLHQIDVFNGDGMCMGYHAWLAGDFGEDQVAHRSADVSGE